MAHMTHMLSALLKARDEGNRLVAGPDTPYAGRAVVYSPRRDTVSPAVPDFYPWQVQGSLDRLSCTQVEAVRP